MGIDPSIKRRFAAPAARGLCVPRADDWFDRALFSLVTRVSGRAVAILTLLFWPGIGLLLPAILDWNRSWLISLNLVGVSLAAAVSLGWLIVQIEAKDRRHLLEWTTELRHLNAQEFEYVVGELFRREGWNVRETGSQDGPDGNIDLELTRGTERRIVQCKRWTSAKIGVDQVRSFAGALLRERLRGKDGIFVTFSQFNEHAIREATKNGIELIDGADLFHRIEAVRRAEPCPTCGRPMILDRSQRGWWFRCVSPGCAGKRDLGAEPARAVALLTQPHVRADA
jgi:hypothetical protein